MQKKYRWSLLVFWLASFSALSAQDNFTLSGYIKDASNGETLIGATVYEPENAVGTSSNEYGFYSLSLPPGTYTVEISYLSYATQNVEVLMNQDVRMDFKMETASQEIEEVVVLAEAEDQNVRDVQMSVNKLDIAQIKSMPTLLGEVEVIRSLQLLPGVSSVGEGASGFNVRGGSIDQNLVLLDEAPVYNSSHLFGFFSVFNPDAVKDVQLYKGGIPARYGGRLSSILDVRMKEGNNQQFEMNGGVGLIFSRLSIEAPIVKDKASFIVAGRRSYIDVLARPFLGDGLDDSELNFYDLTAKANWTINENNRVFASGYFGRDNFVFGEGAGFNWGNATATARWNHIFNQKMFGNLTLFYSDYDYKINFGEDANNSFDWDARIENISGKMDFSYALNTKNQLRFGLQSIFYDFEPGNAVGVSESEVTDFSLDQKFALESGIYVENEQQITSKLKINYGLRWSHFAYLGAGRAYSFEDNDPGGRKTLVGIEEFDSGETIADYNNWEPRIGIQYQLNSSSSLKASFNRMAQYVHLISNTTASTPVDVWLPSTNNIEPQQSWQVAAGYTKNFSNNAYKFTTELYYKDYDNLVDYIDGADLLLNDLVEADLLEGEGRAYGWEVMLEKVKGRFTGWASYTLGRSERLVTGINNDKWYPSRFDQTHNLSLIGFYELTDRITLSANFSLISGTPTTFPTSRYEWQGYVIPHNFDEDRNNVRIPAFHRLDVSMTLKGKHHAERRWDGEWVFGIYNVYNRRNPFSIFVRQDQDRVMPGQMTTTEAVQLSVIGNFIPSVSYNFKFK